MVRALPAKALMALSLSLTFGAASGQSNPPQVAIDRVEAMPNLPRPFAMKDWKSVALCFDRFVFDPNAKGEFLPLLWIDKSHVNGENDGFGIPSYVGHPQMNAGFQHEAVTCLGSVLSATLVGIDKRKGDHDWVDMCRNYFVSSTGENVVLNRTNTRSGGSFWYDIFPQILFDAIAYKYPDTPALDRIVLTAANRWYDACVAMRTPAGVIDFNHTAFSFEKMAPTDNGRWREPDAAGGIAYLMYTAYTKFKTPKFLEAADWAIQFLQKREPQDNPLYEVLLPYGALTAARMNAELGRHYDVEKMLNWCFNPDSTARLGIGVVLGRWGGYDVNGLFGGTTMDYVFGMNTFSMGAALVPLARYDARFARAIGKWMLNAANNCRLFYPDALTEANQTCAWWKGDPEHTIPYEGLRREWKGKKPCAMGDPLVMGWAKTDLALYSGSFAGVFGAIVSRTDEPHILRLDCLATDFYPSKPFPTYLYYNPESTSKKVSLDAGSKPCDLFDAVTKTYLAKNVTGKVGFEIDPDGVRLIVLLPLGAQMLGDGLLAQNAR